MPRLSHPFRLAGCLLLFLLAEVSALRADELTRQVQEELRKRNLYFGDIDGQDTPPVHAALSRYQQRKGFAVNGQFNDETLRSLSLLGPGPDSRTPTPADPAALPWPDIAVLRSDQARQDAPAEAVEPPPAAASVAPPFPPPAAAHVVRGITAEDAHRFVARYLQAGQTNDPAAELAFYAERVDYFDDGVVTQAYIEKDVRRYDHRWPDRQFTLTDSVTTAPGTDPAQTLVEFEYAFVVKSSTLTVRGKTRTIYTLEGSKPEDLRIVRVREQRVRK